MIHFLLSGSVGFSVEEVVLACRSLQSIAEQVQDTEEAGRCFHDVIIPHLLSLALQGALQGKQLQINRHIFIPVSEITYGFDSDLRLSVSFTGSYLTGEGSSGRRSPLVEEVVLSAMVPVISTSCSRLQPMSVQSLCHLLSCLFVCCYEVSCSS